MKSTFKDKHVVITGGSSGLGLALAKRLIEKKARVSLVARNADRLRKAIEQLQSEHPDASLSWQAADVTDETAIATAMAELSDAQGGIDALINSAGILREGYFESLPMSAFREVMEINFFGLLNATRAALPYLKTSGGRLINVASLAGLAGVFGYTPYCSAKHALVGLTESLRYELEPQGLRVHLVCPAEFDSPMVDELDKQRTPENRAHTLTVPKTGVEVIVSGLLRGVEREQFLIVPGTMARAAATAMRHLPGVFRAVADRTVKKVYRGPESSTSAV
ncbi:MAG: SDR family NAD(P)-dependent oxidoreductase [Marinobacter sp.]